VIENKQQYYIDKTHPCLAGHFPNNPIVPGVVILNYVEQQIIQSLPDYQIKSLSQAKFLQPLTPDEIFFITLKQVSNSHIKFTCIRNDSVIVTGSFSIETRKTDYE